MTRTTTDPYAAPDFGDDHPDQRASTVGHPQDLLTIEVRTGVDGTTVELAGEVDLVTAPLLHDRVMTVLDQVPGLDQAARRMVLDMRQVSFLGSSGLAVLVELRTAAQRRDVRLQLVTTSRAVLRPLIATGLIELFEVSAEPIDS
ncbi:MAG TPA: anti-sigma factor antagonist [Pseudonocardiaceae bacterium]|jgi:anti-sigma B factor antagonist